jgi:hypothetical protein
MRGAVISSSAALALVLAAFFSQAAAQAAAPEPDNDYPTEARADYVFGCMAANGQTREILHKCACSLDVVASILPYEKYVDAETVLTMRQGAGFMANSFRVVGKYEDMVADLRRAQAEAEVRCFK